MIAKRTNTFPDRVHYANRTVDGRQIPSHLWETFLTLWRTRGTGSFFVAERSAQRALNKVLLGTGLRVNFDERLEGRGLVALSLVDDRALPPAKRTGLPALPETEEEPVEVLFSELTK